MTFEKEIIAAGLLLPDRTRDIVNERLEAMKRGLLELLAEHEPRTIVIEDTSGKVIRSRHGGGGAGLSIYGKAVGALWQVCAFWNHIRLLRCEWSGQEYEPSRVVLIPENEWTRRRPKQIKGPTKRLSRVDIISNLYPEYDRKKDPGGDIADAIGLGLFHIDAERTEHE